MSAQDVKDLLLQGGGLVLAFMTLVQISPLKIDPWTWIARKVGRDINGEVLERVADLEQKLVKLEQKDDERDVINSRIRILRFADECREGQLHSKEHWDQTMRDITKYDQYCKSRPDFENEITVEASRYLREKYHEHMVNNSFLK